MSRWNELVQKTQQVVTRVQEHRRDVNAGRKAGLNDTEAEQAVEALRKLGQQAVNALVDGVAEPDEVFGLVVSTISLAAGTVRDLRDADPDPRVALDVVEASAASLPEPDVERVVRAVPSDMLERILARRLAASGPTS